MRKGLVCGIGVAFGGLLALAACGGDGGDGATAATAGAGAAATSVTSGRAPASSTPATGPATSAVPPAAKQRATAFVDHVDVGSGAKGVTLLITGQLPTPCHELRWKAGPVDPAGRISVEVYSEIDASALCSQVVQPFAETIPLGTFPSGAYTAIVNGTAYPFRA